MSTYKRSRSEDNILQVSGDDEYDEEYYDTTDATVTPVLIGEAMSRDDPFYQPSISNPFTDLAGFKEGCKILGKSFGDVDSIVFELPSPSSPMTPPSTPNIVAAASSAAVKKSSSAQRRQKSQSLPSSPILLRKAAERLHQESIHGSNSKKSINTNRYSFSAYTSSTRSKSVFFPEAVAQRLQFEMFDTGSPYNGRSREGSVESDSSYNYCNTYPINRFRRHSNLESSGNNRRNDSNSSLSSSYANSRQVSIDESVNNERTNSVYPNLSYASDNANKDQPLLNNNHLPSPTGSKVSFAVSYDENSLANDPWSMRRDTLTDSVIIEEPICKNETMETSV